MSPPSSDRHDDRAARAAYERNVTYKVDSVSGRENEGSTDYADRLLHEKLNVVRQHLQSGLLVDLCCATGQHIWSLRRPDQETIGLDFSVPFLLAADKARLAIGANDVAFVAADARCLPLPSASVGTLYSLSALYQVPEIEKVFAEISRVLRGGGRCILDLGNSRSINSFCVRGYYTELPRSYAIPVGRMRELFARNNMRIVEHRAFQILPLWAGRPRWLLPLLHPLWRWLLAKRVAGRMLDEWISSFPLLKPFAFRHLIVGEKVG
jgi:ubiquinone/menaquinone biosynthesis C-methylase UbiE